MNQVISQPQLSEIVQNRVDDIQSYLQMIDKSRSDIYLDNDIYDNTVDYIKHSY